MKSYFLFIGIFLSAAMISCSRTGSNHNLFGDPQKHHNEVNHHKVKWKSEPGSQLFKEDKNAKKENLKKLKEQKLAEERKRRELERYKYQNNSMKTTDYDPPKREE